MLKKFLKSNVGQYLIAVIVAAYVTCLRLTCKVKVEGTVTPAKFWQQGQPVIIATFHGKLLLLPFFFSPRLLKSKFKKPQVSALISAHSDGRLISKAASMFGVKTITGSSSQGGAQAVRQILKTIKQGNSIFITPDGPKGPRLSVSKGTTEITRMSGAPLIGATYSADKFWQAKSWDKFTVPKPFSTITLTFTQAITCEKRIDDNAMQKFEEQVKKLLMKLEEN